ncbi:hypothetical protein [Noviherbaspirillum aerium]|uniref:hypothetical protein n=1 Tax=Noviherbaspirillum aerium TaxID=2588497 RepID=UPI00124CE89D|nr:hypothetical protein [Noviherbaspirillum aerium]
MSHATHSFERPTHLLTTAPLAYLLDSLRAGTMVHASFARRYFFSASHVSALFAGLYFGFVPFWITMQRTQGNSNAHSARDGEPLLLIDGKRRLAALLAALYRVPLPDADGKKDAVLQIAFHPQTGVFRPVRAGARPPRGWLPDISSVFAPDANLAEIVHAYCVTNPKADPEDVHQKLRRLQNILHLEIPVVYMSIEFTERQVATMFKRMNTRSSKR